MRSVTLQGGQSASYQYDLNGNLTAGDSANPLVGELRVHYDPYNKPFRTQRSGHYSEFWYGADDQRYFQRDSQGLETVYVGKLYEQKGPTKHQLYLGNYAVFTVDITDPSATGLTYLHGDRLGSMVEMSDAAGQLIDNAARGFDPFGKPREGDWSNSNHNDAAGGSVLFPNDLNRPDLTTRGFTGHEQLNNVALTHMNGRAYDYNLGRFLSVDPVIQFPANSQSLNPYSYVLNNPLAGTDPTGYTMTCPESRGELECAPMERRGLPCGRADCDPTMGTPPLYNGAMGQSASDMDQSGPDELMSVDERDLEQSDPCRALASFGCMVEVFGSSVDNAIKNITNAPGDLFRELFAIDQYSYESLSQVCDGSCDNNGLPGGVAESAEMYTAFVLGPLRAGSLSEGATASGYSGMAGSAARQAARLEPAAAKGVLQIDPNGTFSSSEINAAYYMAAQGKNVLLRSPIGTRVGGGTSDLLVDGVRYDVYTPTTSNASRIISAIAKKNSQAEGVVLDLSNSAVTREQLGNVLGRVNGAGATNITNVVIIGK